MNLAFLVGFRASGKTTLGKALNGWKGLQFLDLDAEIERRLGQSILEFVDAQGIEAFRSLEGTFLREILECQGIAYNLPASTVSDPEWKSVSGSAAASGLGYDLGLGAKPLLVALGGGVVDGQESFDLLKSCPFPKILLSVSPETLWQRLEPYPDRRKIGKLQTFSDLERLFQKRAPRWKEIATHSLENQDISQGLLGLKKILGSVWQAAL